MLKTVNKDISSIIDTLNAQISNLLCIDKSLKGLEALSLPFNDYDIKNLPYEISFLHDCIVDCSGELSLARVQLDNFISGYDVCVCDHDTPSNIVCDDLERIDNGLDYLLMIENYFYKVYDASDKEELLDYVNRITNLLVNYRDVVEQLMKMGDSTKLFD